MRMQTSDFQTVTWRRLEKQLSARIEELRIMNDGNLSMEKTAELRGKIAELKQILSLSRQSEKLGAIPDISIVNEDAQLSSDLQ